jgi:hypothetical protein
MLALRAAGQAHTDLWIRQNGFAVWQEGGDFDATYRQRGFVEDLRIHRQRPVLTANWAGSSERRTRLPFQLEPAYAPVPPARLADGLELESALI